MQGRTGSCFDRCNLDPFKPSTEPRMIRTRASQPLLFLIILLISKHVAENFQGFNRLAASQGPPSFVAARCPASWENVAGPDFGAGGRARNRGGEFRASPGCEGGLSQPSAGRDLEESGVPGISHAKAGGLVAVLGRDPGMPGGHHRSSVFLRTDAGSGGLGERLLVGICDGSRRVFPPRRAGRDALGAPHGIRGISPGQGK